jgi:hypothetical protein
MCGRGLASWPPAWVWRSGPAETRVRGEVGILNDAMQSVLGPRDRLFLVMVHDWNEYIGCLLLDEVSFCRHIYKLLKSHRGLPVKQIGGLDLEYTL